MFGLRRKHMQILMLQPDAFWEHTIQQDANAAGAPPRTPLGELTALLRHPGWFSGGRPAGEGEGEKGKEGGAGKGRKGAMREIKGKGKEGQGWRWRGRGRTLEQGRRLAKAGPDQSTWNLTRVIMSGYNPACQKFKKKSAPLNNFADFSVSVLNEKLWILALFCLAFLF